MKNVLFLFLAILISPLFYGQCKIQNKVQPDGSMLYFVESATFYTTQSKSLKIGLVTDKEDYFIALQPLPFPLKENGKLIKDDLVIELSDAKKYILKHYDTRYIKHDSVMEVLYLIDKKDLKSFSVYEALSADINMKGTEFVRNYTFKLHKNAIVEQLACFLKE